MIANLNRSCNIFIQQQARCPNNFLYDHDDFELVAVSTPHYITENRTQTVPLWTLLSNINNVVRIIAIVKISLKHQSIFKGVAKGRVSNSVFYVTALLTFAGLRRSMPAASRGFAQGIPCYVTQRKIKGNGCVNIISFLNVVCLLWQQTLFLSDGIIGFDVEILRSENEAYFWRSGLKSSKIFEYLQNILWEKVNRHLLQEMHLK